MSCCIYFGRLSYDAAVAKFEKLKGSKKEKERKEAEEEMERAKERLYAWFYYVAS